MLEVGIDWGQKSPNAFAILAENGNLVKKGSVQRSAEGAQQMIEQIKELEPDPQQVRTGIDRKNDILPHILCSEGYVVYPLNPLSADRARDIYYPAGNKDDRVDAEVHARMVRNSWRNRTEYDEAFHRRNCAARGAAAACGGSFREGPNGISKPKKDAKWSKQPQDAVFKPICGRKPPAN